MQVAIQQKYISWSRIYTHKPTNQYVSFIDGIQVENIITGLILVDRNSVATWGVVNTSVCVK